MIVTATPYLGAKRPQVHLSVEKEGHNLNSAHLALEESLSQAIKAGYDIHQAPFMMVLTWRE